MERSDEFDSRLWGPSELCGTDSTVKSITAGSALQIPTRIWRSPTALGPACLYAYLFLHSPYIHTLTPIGVMAACFLEEPAQAGSAGSLREEVWNAQDDAMCAFPRLGGWQSEVWWWKERARPVHFQCPLVDPTLAPVFPKGYKEVMLSEPGFVPMKHRQSCS